MEVSYYAIRTVECTHDSQNLFFKQSQKSEAGLKIFPSSIFASKFEAWSLKILESEEYHFIDDERMQYLSLRLKTIWVVIISTKSYKSLEMNNLEMFPKVLKRAAIIKAPKLLDELIKTFRKKDKSHCLTNRKNKWTSEREND